MTSLPALRLAAIAITISGLLHLISPMVAGWSPDTQQLLPFGILYPLIGWGVLKGRRWLAWIAFLATLFGSAVALFSAFGPSAVPAWLYLSIVVANMICWVSLFGYLWRPKPNPALY